MPIPLLSRGHLLETSAFLTGSGGRGVNNGRPSRLFNSSTKISKERTQRSASETPTATNGWPSLAASITARFLRRGGPESNLAVFSARRSPGKSLYVADDWGSSMGKWGGFFERDKWDSAAYEKQTRDFVKGANAGVIDWGFRGKHDEDIKNGITVEDVRWLLQYLSPTTDEDLRAGLRASGGSERDTESFTRAIRDRIRQLEIISKTNSTG